jgi:hypothetical protein
LGRFIDIVNCVWVKCLMLNRFVWPTFIQKCNGEEIYKQYKMEDILDFFIGIIIMIGPFLLVAAWCFLGWVFHSSFIEPDEPLSSSFFVFWMLVLVAIILLYHSFGTPNLD